MPKSNKPARAEEKPTKKTKGAKASPAAAKAVKSAKPTKSASRPSAGGKGKATGAGKAARAEVPSKQRSEPATKAPAKGTSTTEARVVRPVDPVIHEERASASAASKRKLGLRGAAPWAARHAAKHAAEARARAAEPAPPGSARATIRTPNDAEVIKERINALSQLTHKVRSLRKRLDKNFFEVGETLGQIQREELHKAKGYGSFEAFLERESELGKLLGLKLIRVSQVFQKEAALDYGYERVILSLAALEGELVGPGSHPSMPSAPGSRPALPLVRIPPA
jgi:hypothetical protein